MLYRAKKNTLITNLSGQDRRFDERPQQPHQQHRDGKPGNDRGDRKSGRGENCDTTARGNSARNQEARKLKSFFFYFCSFILHTKEYTSVTDCNYKAAIRKV